MFVVQFSLMICKNQLLEHFFFIMCDEVLEYYKFSHIKIRTFGMNMLHGLQILK